MKRWLAGVSVTALLCVAGAAKAATPGHYLFAWAGDTAGRGEDFIAVIDADPGSPGYGKLIASAASGIRSHQVHHTEYWMPSAFPRLVPRNSDQHVSAKSWELQTTC